MTATPRVWSAKEQATKLEEQLVYSMDDETVYGPLLHNLSYSKAVDLGLSPIPSYWSSPTTRRASLVTPGCRD